MQEAVEEVPLTYNAFLAGFGTEQACVSALFAARWPDGFRCPACGGARYYPVSTRRLPLYECVKCRLQTSVIAGTVMEGSRTSLTRWFHAIYLLSRPDGISALRLADVIQVTYKTAWLMAHKIRSAMSDADASVRLTGNLRIDRCYYGDPVFDDARQPLLIGASVDDEETPVFIKIKQPLPHHVVSDKRFIKPEGIQAFYEEHTDYADTPDSYRYRKAHSTLWPIIQAFPAWLNLTFNGIGAKHLQLYLDEFAFRQNCALQNFAAFSTSLYWCANSRALAYPVLTAYRPTLDTPWLVFGSKARWRGTHLSRWGA
ncbi:IS1595 family transposase [Cohnella sp. JJ-181]|uniref:IS1595 family transposase n=1 Tax=Cohnella rhizoplanae TaxID=2974897 RepID=UPI0022FFBC4B|nr:IS1595 family transposase [Cohnella sp. JJ-181]CAI6014858.1 hypothetical protein COHCIP112018_00051 [Cohnella sp. JJ-181]